MPGAQVGAEIVKRALGYPLKLIASNAGVNGSVVMQKVMDHADKNVGYNAATGAYEDLMAAGIIDPTKVGPRHFSGKNVNRVRVVHYVCACMVTMMHCHAPLQSGRRVPTCE